jgi:hypothetical protein
VDAASEYEFLPEEAFRMPYDFKLTLGRKEKLRILKVVILY